jgi:hypothetical protein
MLHAQKPRKVLFKGPIMYPNPSNNQKVLLTIRYRHVLIMILSGVRFLGFAGVGPSFKVASPRN